MAPRTLRTTQRARTRFLDSLRVGKSVRAACEAALIGRRTAYDLRDKEPEFAAAWDEAVEEGTDLIEDEALRRAVDGVEEAVISQGRLAKDDEGKVLTVRRYSDTLIINLLKSRRPNKYRERTSTEITGGLNVTITGKDADL